MKDKYGVDLFLLDRKSGHLYVPNQNGIYSIIEEKGWIYPTESMMIDPVARNLSMSGSVTPQTLHLTGINPTPDIESTRDSIRYGPKRPPKTVRELLNEKRRNTPTTGSGYQSFNQTLTIRELMVDKTKLAGLTLETSPALQEYLDHEHQLHLQMIEEQKQLEDLRKQKIQDQLEERRRKLEEQEIAQQRDWEEHQQKEREKKMNEIEQQCLLELEQRAIQADLEKARREKLEAEQRKAELEAQVKAIEEEKLKEEQRICQEDRERKCQQQEAERILKELDERRKRIAAVASHHEDVIIDGEIDQMKEELFGPDGQLDEAKMGFAGHLSRYPSREYLAEGQQGNLTRRERKYYEEKERVILTIISITDSTYYERRMYQRNETQAQNFQLEYQSILAELKRQLAVCQRILKLPNAPIPNYPSPVSVRTPSVELEKEEIEYYLDKFEESQKRDQHATQIHVRRLEEVEESEQQKLCYLPRAEYERRSKLQRQRINYAVSEKGKKPRPPKIPVTPPQSPKSKKKVTPEPDYLPLVPIRREHQTPEPSRDSPSKGKEPIPIPLGMSIEKQTPPRHTPPDVRRKLLIEGPKEPVTNTSQKGIQVQKQVVPYKPAWPDKGPNRVLVEPLGGNTIPIKYSKGVGRNGGIERLTSTEAQNSQDSAVETVKQFFHNGSPKSERVPSDHSGSQEELVWDYNDGIGRGNDIQQPKDVTPDVVQETKEKEMRPFGDPLASLKNLVAKQIQSRKGLITMPIPA